MKMVSHLVDVEDRSEDSWLTYISTHNISKNLYVYILDLLLSVRGRQTFRNYSHLPRTVTSRTSFCFFNFGLSEYLGKDLISLFNL